MFSLLLYCAPRYWRKRSVSVSSHVFCSSISMTRSLNSLLSASFSLTVAAKSMRNMESVSRVVLTYSCGRISTFTTSFFSSADRMVFDMRSSAIMYLNTESYIGLATCSIISVERFLIIIFANLHILCELQHFASVFFDISFFSFSSADHIAWASVLLSYIYYHSNCRMSRFL